MKYDIVVVGGGIAGLTAAAYTAKAGKSVALYEQQPTVGGMVQTFEREGVFFDSGLRSIENSGIVFPMLKQLGIEIEFQKSITSIGIGNSVMEIQNKDSVNKYELFLQNEFPENKKDISLIILEIKKIMGYMDVLYAVDNPTFMDIGKDLPYLFRKFLPWTLKFITTINKINKLNQPVEEYLKQFTKNQALIDSIAQHFFQQTPTSFALSYFSLYLDYHYPKGGTATLINKMAEFITKNNGTIHTANKIHSIHPEQKYVIDQNNTQITYNQLIWAADLKNLYNRIPITEITNKNLAHKIQTKKTQLKKLKGGDSVFTSYITVNLDKKYFSDICTGHFFFTPSKNGLSSLNKTRIQPFLNTQNPDKNNQQLKQTVIQYLKEYFDLNTFEIAIPSLRDPHLAPKGKTGLIVSLLFDYQLTKKIEQAQWTKEIKTILQQHIIHILDQTIFPGLTQNVTNTFSSTPLTIENLTSSTHGGITGWAFTNPHMPVVNKMLSVAKSVETILPSIYQAGQWAYSPSGFPISILTGKLAADKALKNAT